MEKLKVILKNVRFDMSKLSLILILCVIFSPALAVLFRVLSLNSFTMFKLLKYGNFNVILFFVYFVGAIGFASFLYYLFAKIFKQSKNKLSIKSLIPLYLFIAFLVCLLFSCLFANNTKLAFCGSEYRHEGYYTYLAYAGICFLSILIKPEKKKTVYNALIVVALFLAILNLLRFEGKDMIFIYNSAKTSIFTNQNHFAYFLVIPIISSIMFLESEKWYLKPFYLISYLILLITLIDQWTTGSYLAILVTILVILVYQIIAKKKWVFGLIALGVFIICSLTHNSTYTNLPIIDDIKIVTNQATSIVGKDKENIINFAKADEIKDYKELDKDEKVIANYGSKRLLIWINSLKLIKKKLLLGYGLENVSEDMLKGGAGRPHNLILQMCLFAGIPGALLYLTAVAIIMIKGLINFKYIDTIIAVSYFGCFAYLISAMFGNTMYYTSPFFLIFLGMLYGKEIRQYFIAN